MTAAWIAFWAMVIAPSTLYLCKRLIDIVLPPGTHVNWLDPWLKPNKVAAPPKEETDEQS